MSAQAAETLGNEIAQHASEFAPRRRRADRPENPPAETPPTPDPVTELTSRTLSPEALRHAIAAETIIQERNKIADERDKLIIQLHQAESRIEQFQIANNGLTNDKETLTLQRDTLQRKYHKIIAIVRALRNAISGTLDDELVDDLESGT